MGQPAGISPEGGYDPAFFDTLAAVEDRHFWFRARNKLISELTKAIVASLQPGYLVLEVGCGTGNVLRILREVCTQGNVVGLELWFDGLKHARERSGCAVVQGDVCSFPFGKRFDLIGMFDVLEHIPEERTTLAALREALVPGGKLMLTVPAHQFLWSHFDEAARHCRRYSASGLRERLVQAGFEIEFLSPFMASIFPMVWAYRRLGRIRQTNSVEEQRQLAAGEFRIVPLLNGTLASVLRLEASWLGRRHTLPFGTSLVAVARRPR